MQPVVGISLLNIVNMSLSMCRNSFGLRIYLDLLGNQLYRQERSEQLLTITNRFGYTPSYNTMIQVHAEAAERPHRSSTPIFCTREHLNSFDDNFIAKVANNFDIDPNRLHGNNSIFFLVCKNLDSKII